MSNLVCRSKIDNIHQCAKRQEPLRCLCHCLARHAPTHCIETADLSNAKSKYLLSLSSPTCGNWHSYAALNLKIYWYLELGTSKHGLFASGINVFISTLRQFNCYTLNSGNRHSVSCLVYTTDILGSHLLYSDVMLMIYINWNKHEQLQGIFNFILMHF